MKPDQIGAIAQMILLAEQVGLEVIGGAKALAALFHAKPTDAELDAIVDGVVADAQRRRDELAAGLPPKT